MVTPLTLNRSWVHTLQQTLARLRLKHPAHLAILGLGHELRGDDAVGVFIAHALRDTALGQCPDILVVEAGAAPENYTGQLRRFGPHLVLLIDAALLDAPPGTVRWLEGPVIASVNITTHTLPLSLLIGYLIAELKCAVALLGIQAAQTTLGAPLSPPVQHAADDIIHVLSVEAGLAPVQTFI